MGKILDIQYSVWLSTDAPFEKYLYNVMNNGFSNVLLKEETLLKGSINPNINERFWVSRFQNNTA